eukprot:scaffold129782_cov75-Phaeocystis_antarctica.AAC.3
MHLPGALPSEWLQLPNRGPLCGLSGTDACPRCYAWRFPCEPLRCCLPDPKQPDRAAFIPAEVDLRASEELFELECLFSGDHALAKHFRRHGHLFNSSYSYASLKRVAKQTPLSGKRRHSLSTRSVHIH